MMQAIMDIAANGVTYPFHRALADKGIPKATIARLTGEGLLGRAWVRIEGQRWTLAEPKEHGAEPRLILGVVADGELIDLAAISGRNEDEWALFAGVADILGADALDDIDRELAAERPGIITLHATPMDWLRSGGQGACVVDWSRSARAMLRSLGPRAAIEVSSPLMAANLDRELRQGGLPSITVAKQEMGLAA